MSVERPGGAQANGASRDRLFTIKCRMPATVTQVMNQTRRMFNVTDRASLAEQAYGQCRVGAL